MSQQEFTSLQQLNEAISQQLYLLNKKAFVYTMLTASSTMLCPVGCKVVWQLR